MSFEAFYRYCYLATTIFQMQSPRFTKQSVQKTRVRVGEKQVTGGSKRQNGKIKHDYICLNWHVHHLRKIEQEIKYIKCLGILGHIYGYSNDHLRIGKFYSDYSKFGHQLNR